jgi:2-polyprenyl-3-methyl-5-hydroxy-6-metoxy-1,4-benzoquinol methylase
MSTIKKILEIGCGSGGFAWWLSRLEPRFTKVIAVDFSDVAISKAKSLFETMPPHLDFQVGDITNLQDFKSEEFDTVISCETIEHVENPQGAVLELSRVLKPDGNLFLTTPNYMSTIGLYRIYCNMRGRKFTECGQPINQFTTIRKTCSWIKKAGLEITGTYSIGHYLPIPGRPPLRINLFDKQINIIKWFGHHSLVTAKKPNLLSL